ncbi:MAG: hypothetical protein ACRC2V_06925 [Xenococcaceae cyanobacterium]
MTQSPFPSEDRFAEQNSKEIDTAVNRSDAIRLPYLDGVRGLAALYVNNPSPLRTRTRSFQ